MIPRVGFGGIVFTAGISSLYPYGRLDCLDTLNIGLGPYHCKDFFESAKESYPQWNGTNREQELRPESRTNREQLSRLRSTPPASALALANLPGTKKPARFKFSYKHYESSPVPSFCGK